MPKELTHWILAERALARLDMDNRIGQLIRAYRGYYLAGAVLPDALMHLSGGPHSAAAMALANNFHDSRGNSYEPLIRFEESCPNGLPPQTKACLLGVLCHMQSDIVLHPFIYGISGISDIGRHYRLETAIDVLLLCNGSVAPAQRLTELITPDMWPDLIEICSMLFDRNASLPQQAVRQALESHCRFQAMYDRTLWKLAAKLLGLLPVPQLKQWQNLFYPLYVSESWRSVEGDGAWRHPVTGEQRDTSLDELTDIVVRRTAGFFNSIEKQGSLKAVLEREQGENLLTGIHGVQKCAMEKDYTG